MKNLRHDLIKLRNLSSEKNAKFKKQSSMYWKKPIVSYILILSVFQWLMLAYFQCLTWCVLTPLSWAGRGWKNPAYVCGHILFDTCTYVKDTKSSINFWIKNGHSDFVLSLNKLMFDLLSFCPRFRLRAKYYTSMYKRRTEIFPSYKLSLGIRETVWWTLLISTYILEDLGGTDKADVYICRGGPVEKRLYKKKSKYSKFEFSFVLVFVIETTDWDNSVTESQFLAAKHWLSWLPVTEKLRRTVLY